MKSVHEGDRNCATAAMEIRDAVPLGIGCLVRQQRGGGGRRRQHRGHTETARNLPEICDDARVTEAVARQRQQSLAIEEGAQAERACAANVEIRHGVADHAILRRAHQRTDRPRHSQQAHMRELGELRRPRRPARRHVHDDVSAVGRRREIQAAGAMAPRKTLEILGNVGGIEEQHMTQARNLVPDAGELGPDRIVRRQEDVDLRGPQ